jgi:hypothetical protein
MPVGDWQMGVLLTAISAAAAITAQPSLPPLPNASPAMWVVRDADTTVYLFGTFHALDGNSDWFNDEVSAAFTHSDELILETLLPKLDSRPPAASVRKSTGYSVASSASFLGATRMAVSAGRQRGLDVRKGADMVLRRAAEQSGKRIGALETIGFQLGMLSRLAPPGAKPATSAAPDRAAADRGTANEVATLMTYMQAAWNRGEQGIFVALLNQMRDTSPDSYRIMFPERNANWADWIVNRMERPGTVFVAVGAGHFAGTDSVLTKLSARGVSATRMN